jgi:PDZ domain/Right handed beta helix region
MKLIVLTIVIFIGVSALGQQRLFVSETGNDKSSGTLKKPLLTLERAISVAQNSSSKKIDILLRGGTYYPETTVELDGEKLKGKIINISAYKKEVVTTSAAKKLTVSWRLFKDNIYQAAIEVPFDPDALFVDGNVRAMARYPNYDSTARVFNGVAYDAISDNRVKQWNNPEGGFFHALHSGEWGGFHYRITGKDIEGKLLMDGGWQNNRPSPLHKEFRFVENIFEELDAPGEWYYNHKERILYYYPLTKSEIQNATFEVSRLKSLIAITGSEANPLSNIRISNIKFAHTKRTLMEKHEPLLRSDWMLHRSGAILIEGSENCEIINCEFSELGATAVMVNGYNRNVTISNNHFKNIGGSAICFVGDVSSVRSPAFQYEQLLAFEVIDKIPGPKNNLFPKNCLVYNNLIHDIGKIEKQATGVQISMSESIAVRNNTIYNTPRAGINIGDGTWGGHIIEYNDVFNTVQETGDHGSFNSWGRDRYWNANRNYMDSITLAHPEIILLDAQKTTVIHDNRFRCDHGWDIDLDDGSSNYHLYNNLCLNGGIKLREGFFRTVENNIMINNSFHPHVWFQNSGDVFRRNIVTRNYYPINVPYWGKEVDFNFFPDSVALNKALKNNTDKNSFYGTPEFINPSTGNFQVSEKSRAMATGFKNIDMNNFGVIDPSLKAKALKVEIPLLIMPSTDVDDKTTTVNWLDAVLRNVNGLADRSAYGLPSTAGVIVISIEKKSDKEKSGLQTTDVIVEVEGVPVKDIFDLMSQYQAVNWTGKMNVTVIRNQQLKTISLKLKLK